MTVHAPRRKPKRMGRLGKIRRLTRQELHDFIDSRPSERASGDGSAWTKRYRKVRKRATDAINRRLKKRDEAKDTARWEEKNKDRLAVARERLGL